MRFNNTRWYSIGSEFKKPDFVGLLSLNYRIISSMKIIVIGKNGQVSRHLGKVLGDKAIFLSHAQLDLAHIDTIYPTILATQADVIINAGAYTDTKRAETEQGVAYAINGASVGELARVAKDLNALLIHISTDYVFDGEKQGAYLETDMVNPVSVYGASKLLGEQLIVAISPKHIILRTSWVFSEYRDNFVKTIVKLAQERAQLDIVADQVGCPTYAGHLATVIGELVLRYGKQSDDAFVSGLYHYADADVCSWFEFAQAIVAAVQVHNSPPSVAILNAVASEAWPSPIKRPKNGELNGEKLRQDFAVERFNWRDALPNVIANLTWTLY